ncbi:MAG TPA: serine--tRNA ligase [Pseudonocardiaceae bacterium]|jgi:seryl-tRNA synthetase|nr:serine--tRNA ligase [Pseudonocardiaceae bacterium]
MHDPRVLLDPATDAVRKLARRGYQLDLGRLEKLTSQRSVAIRQVDEARAESNRIAQEVRAAGKRGEDTTPLVERARALKTQIAESEQEQRQFDEELQIFLLAIPNLPEDRSPDGDSDDFAVEVRKWGTPPTFDFEPRDHVDLGEGLGIFDFARATKLSGPRFAVVKGLGARLERAIAQFFLDLHIERHGYTEFSLPALVTRATMTGTGQLPKFEEDLFKTAVAERELFLIPTAEVPLTNMHAGETLPAEDLPLAYTSWTPCFRSEAGSYGRDTKGLIRLHQFAKVEMVRFCDPKRSSEELELMLGHAETCLKELGLAYRVVALAAGDISFAAQFTYDIEVWLPSQQRYREISSCSDCSTFQGRRAGIRMKTKDGKRGFVATLNGSGLPIGRTLVAILEQGQQADGSVRLPDVLVPYLGFHTINADGTTSK